MKLRSASFALGLLFSTLVACSGSIFDDDCGASTCGACQEGFASSDRCEGGVWQCECVPSESASSNAAKSSNDGGGDASTDVSRPQVLTCEQKLANPSASGVCPADEWDKPCEQGCLSCRCLGGTWGACTTSASCFDGG